jgi:hypothetical protein
MDEIVGLAMVGTQRRSPDWKGPLLSELQGSPEARLLGAAALLSTTALAGRPLSDGTALPKDLGLDGRPTAPTRSLRRLLNDSDFTPLLPAWLELARQSGRRPPPQALPELLEAGRRDRSLRSLLREVCGARAQWLAAHNSAWGYLLSGDEEGEDFWHTGPAAARIDWWERLRRADAGRARALLLSTWREESAEDRQKCLSALRPGLSADDEDFLEAALDDRSQGVRRQAARLLAALPTSGLARRLGTEIGTWVQEQQGSTLTLEVALPQECPATLQRDGVEVKPPRGMGEKAWWLQQGVALAPLTVWRADPVDLLAAAAKTDFAENLLAGWRDAACLQRNASWAQALLHVGDSDDTDLFMILPSKQREQLLIGKLGQVPVRWLTLHGPFTPAVAQVVLNWLRGITAGPYNYELGQRLPDLALAFPPQVQECEKGWPEGSGPWRRWRGPVEIFLRRLKFCQSMNEEMLS